MYSFALEPLNLQPSGTLNLGRVSKTEFESIEITILDEDPAMASKIVENLIDFADKKIQAIQKQKAFEVVKLNKQMFLAVKNQLDSVDTLIKNYSVFTL